MKEKSEIKNKSVAFNLLDDFQKELYEYSCKKTNFSDYVKRLIYEELKEKKKREK